VHPSSLRKTQNCTKLWTNKTTLVQKQGHIYLNLILVSSSNIGDGPTGFLLDALFVVVSKKCKEAWKCLVVDNELKSQ
jgi:hypothetical protein